jgi:hypothetical protein
MKLNDCHMGSLSENLSIVLSPHLHARLMPETEIKLSNSAKFLVCVCVCVCVCIG